MTPEPGSRNPVWPWVGACVLLPLAVAASVSCWRSAEEHAAVNVNRDTPDPPLEQPAQEEGPIRLANATRQAGLTFQHTDGGTGQKYLVETVSAGIALFDFDGDSLIDIYFLNGAPLPPASPRPETTNVLYRNEGDFHFRDVTRLAGVADTGYGLGAVAGDYDGDGDQDLYINNFGPNVLYRNNGDGTFSNVTQQAGVACGSMVGAGAAFLDADRDGDLDLYVANYIQFDYAEHKPRSIDGFPCYPGPLDYAPAPDALYRNNGDGTFSDISDASGIAQVAGTGMGMVCADYDNDRDTDVFVVNDELGNMLFENDGSGKFEEVGIIRAVAFDFQGRPQGNMGVDCGDLDNDGWLDFFSTSFSRELPALYRNRDGRFFEDATLSSGAGRRARPHVNWGTAIADMDNDGWRDLFIACGHIDQEVHLWNPNTAFRLPNLVLRNTGSGRFEDVSQQSGDGLQVCESSRGIGVDDLDNDGDLDVVILNSRGPATVLRNDTESRNHWLQIRLKSRTANRQGVGAHVRVTAGGSTQVAEVHCGRGYQSHHGQQLHFGLGPSDHADRIEVLWLGGGSDVFDNVAADQQLVLVQGKEKGEAYISRVGLGRLGKLLTGPYMSQIK